VLLTILLLLRGCGRLRAKLVHRQCDNKRIDRPCLGLNLSFPNVADLDGSVVDASGSGSIGILEREAVLRHILKAVLPDEGDIACVGR
jgi:hypothetical protein